VLVDDADLLLDHPVDEVLTTIARDSATTAVAVAGTTSTLLRAFRGIACTARTARTGLLLNPAGPSDGELYGVRTPLPGRALPGRGLLVVRGATTPIQVAR
jgi:S-DNA-T family DNA segregation ATPase FtsK/SpoIIIE